MIDVILTRLGSIHENLRSDQVCGETQALPTSGESFVMTADPIDENAFIRMVKTSPVKEVRLHPDDGALEFWTENSHYGLQVLDMDVKGGTH